jgi:hypothetical protein
MKILEGYEAKPRVASTDLEIDDSGGETSINDKALKIPFVVCPASSLTRQSPASKYERVPTAVNRSKMDWVRGVHLQLLPKSYDVVIDTSTGARLVTSHTSLSSSSRDIMRSAFCTINFNILNSWGVTLALIRADRCTATRTRVNNSAAGQLRNVIFSAQFYN